MEYPIILLKGMLLSGTIAHSDVTLCDDYSFESVLTALAIESHGAGVLDMVVLSKRSWLFVSYIQ